MNRLLAALSLLLLPSLGQAAGYVATSTYHVPNTAALKSYNIPYATQVVRDGYSTPGDGGRSVYNLDYRACSANGGAGDDQTQVPAAVTGSPACWLIDSSLPPIGGPMPPGGKLFVAGTLTGVLPTLALDGTTSPFATIAVTADNATPTTATSALTVDHYFGGNTDTVGCPTVGGLGAKQCSHFGIWSHLVRTAASPGLSFDSGIFSDVIANAAGNAGYTQALFGVAEQVEDNGGHYYGVVGAEYDISLRHNNTHIKEGVGIFSAPLTQGVDLFQGDQYSAGLGISAAGPCGAGGLAGGSACAGFVYGIALGRTDSYFPLIPTGTIMGVPTALGTPTAAHGIDFSNVTFSQDAFKSNGFRVDQNGTPNLSHIFPSIVFNDTVLTPTTGGLVRLSSGGSTGYEWQINTAAGADFSTALTPLILAPGGSVQLGEPGATVEARADLQLDRHLYYSGSASAASSCGTPTVTGRDGAGGVTMTGAPTACTITFNVAFSHTPFCTVSPTTDVRLWISAASGSAFTVSSSAGMTGLYWHCEG